MRFLAKRIANHQAVDLLFDFREKLSYLNSDELREYYKKLFEITPANNRKNRCKYTLYGIYT